LPDWACSAANSPGLANQEQETRFGGFFAFFVARVPLSIAGLTVSDTRSEADDTSGHYLATALTKAGHELADRWLVRDGSYQIRAAASAWLAADAVKAELIT
jgi:molybdopterin biosynthesis enzyme MoaB